MKKPLVQVSPEMTEECLRAIEVWGQLDQLVQSTGECGEFLAAFGRYMAAVGRHFQGRDPEMVDLTDEAADVVILMMQVRELVGAENFDAALSKKFEKFQAKVRQASADGDEDDYPDDEGLHLLPSWMGQTEDDL